MAAQLAPSILSADFMRIGKLMSIVEKAGADLWHIDVMDGHFVPNISIGLPVVRSISKTTKLPLDVHLMIENPAGYLERFREAGAKWISIHAEAVPLLHRALDDIKRLGAKAGVVLNPATPLHVIDEAVEYADFILLMSVEPGFGGQSFIRPVYKKIKCLKSTLRKRKLKGLIQVDGGIGEKNCRKVVQAGADIIVVGSAIFSAKDPAEAAKKIKEKIR
ncbi:ribulose-phosphate 3-epimerase [Acidobacteriota bacterium]